VLEPMEREQAATSLRQDCAISPTSVASSAVAEFYGETLYPLWHTAETFGFAPAQVGDRVRRQFPDFAWPFDGVQCHRVLCAGAGAGHQVAQFLLTHVDCDVVALDCSATSLAYASAQTERCLPRELPRVTNVVGDIASLSAGSGPAHAAHIAPGFHLVCCIGVLHHLGDVAGGLRQLERALLPGGVLQLATYSHISVDTWRPAAKRLLHKLTPNLIDATGGLVRQPDAAELCALRARVFELAGGGGAGDPLEEEEEEETRIASALLDFEELYSSAGARDLLFHPQERALTLLELDDLLSAAHLKPIGVFFASTEADRLARAAYRAAPQGTDPSQAKLRLWHQLEESQPHLFGRMHVVFCQKEQLQQKS